MITFYLNGNRHQLTDLNPNTTVLEYLRLHARQTDTKEGCGSGDCGACTVMAQRLPNNDEADTAPFYTLNSCITLLALMDGHHIMTTAYLADNPQNHPERALLHPAQQAMVDCHGSQCGYCTPGFVMSLASVYENKQLQKTKRAPADASSDDALSYDDVVASISGNLCRCTGYRPIIEAGLNMEKIGQQRALENITAKDLTAHLAIDVMSEATPSTTVKDTTSVSSDPIEPMLSEGTRKLFIPKSEDELNQLLAVYPDATLWAGGTDLGLSVTQHLIDHEVIIQLSAIASLKSWSLSKNDASVHGEAGADALIFGAGMSYAGMLPVLEQHFPAFARLFERIASPQIRNMGTIGGNVANASPIGDLPPVLLALNARIHLRHCDDNGTVTDDVMPLSDFFLDYKKTKLAAGGYVVALHIPLMQDHQHLFIHKISKRYEDDISACLLAANIEVSADGKTITDAKLGLGGMAAVPLLAAHTQQALVGQPTSLESFEQAARVLTQDVSPMSDVRASREYRMHVVQRLLIKCGKQVIKDHQEASA